MIFGFGLDKSIVELMFWCMRLFVEFVEMDIVIEIVLERFFFVLVLLV